MQGFDSQIGTGELLALAREAAHDCALVSVDLLGGSEREVVDAAIEEIERSELFLEWIDQNSRCFSQSEN